MVAKVGVAVGIWSQEQSVRLLLFSFPVSVAVILIVGSRPKSGNVCQCRHYHCQVEQLRPKIRGGVEIGIAAPSLTVQRVFPIPVPV